MARAASVFPLPGGPTIRAGPSTDATSAIRLNRACMAGEVPTSAGVSSSGAAEAPSLRPAARARATTAATWSRSNGLTRKSKAPERTARTAVSRSPNAVITTIGAAAATARRSGIASMPSRPGRRTSRRRRSGVSAAAVARPAATVAARSTTCPSSVSISRRLQPMAASSSITRILLTCRSPRWIASPPTPADASRTACGRRAATRRASRHAARPPHGPR